jgi:subtilisin family serine protease
MASSFMNIDLQNSSTPVQTSDECLWALEQMQVYESWNALARKGNDKPGLGITIAHLDTGVIPLRSLLFTNRISDGSDGLQFAADKSSHSGFNFVQPSTSPLDNDPKAPSFGHGTSTASLLVGWLNPDANQRFEFRGLAPWLRLIPIKVTDSVVMVGNMSTGGSADLKNLAKGIELASSLNANVISISLGALFDSEKLLEKSVQKAIENGAIIVAAAGQTFPVGLVPLPARLPGVIAVSASTRDQKPWSEAFVGKHIDWSVPGARICHIKAGRISRTPNIPLNVDSIVRILGRHGETLNFTDSLISSSGTSFSTAYTAGAAALWLQFHTPEALASRYGRKNISNLFEVTAKTYAMETPPGWQSEKHGRGILNIHKLISAPLPCDDGDSKESCEVKTANFLNSSP